MPDTPDTDPAPQPLSEFLINYPDFDRAAGAELAELAATVAAMDRKGSMALKLEVAKVGQNNARLIVKVATEVKPPKSDPDAGLFFPGARGLSKDDPQQVRVDWETGELITPDAPKDA
jgi:hypothetical protein